MLTTNMIKVLSTSYTFAVKAQQFHWNVMGPNFPQYHELFGSIYGEVSGSIDTTAEIIRTLGVFAPGSFSEFIENTMITDDESAAMSDRAMIEQLIADNETIIEVLKTAYESAELEQEYDVSDFLAGRIHSHKKHGWMMHSILGQQRMP